MGWFLYYRNLCHEGVNLVTCINQLEAAVCWYYMEYLFWNISEMSQSTAISPMNFISSANTPSSLFCYSNKRTCGIRWTSRKRLYCSHWANLIKCFITLSVVWNMVNCARQATTSHWETLVQSRQSSFQESIRRATSNIDLVPWLLLLNKYLLLSYN